MECAGAFGSPGGGPCPDGSSSAGASTAPAADHDPTPTNDAVPEDGAYDDSGGGTAGFTRPGEDRQEASGPRASREISPRRERIGERTEDFVDTVESAIERAVPPRVRSRLNPRQNTVVNVMWRGFVLLAGLTLVSLGIVLLLLPGPGWALILLGLAILATEFTWANRLAVPIRRRLQAGASQARSLTRRQQAGFAAVALLAIAALAAFGSWFWTHTGWTLPWVS